MMAFAMERNRDVICFNQGCQWNSQIFLNAEFTISLVQMPFAAVCSRNAIDPFGCINKSPVVIEKIDLLSFVLSKEIYFALRKLSCCGISFLR